MTINDALKKGCKKPVYLGSDPLTQKEVEKFWGTDRVALIDCGLKYDAMKKLFKVQ